MSLWISANIFHGSSFFASWIWALVNGNAIIQVLLHFLSVLPERPECTALTAVHGCRDPRRCHTQTPDTCEQIHMCINIDICCRKAFLRLISILPSPARLIETCFLSCQPLLHRDTRCLKNRDRQIRKREKWATDRGEDRQMKTYSKGKKDRDRRLIKETS